MKMSKLGDERGLSMIIVLGVTIILMTVGSSMIGLMNTDLTHASIQHALATSYQNAQAGLQQARSEFFVAGRDPLTYTTSASGVTQDPYGWYGRFTYWIDAGPAAVNPCPEGLKTLEALGETTYLGQVINSRVRACAVPGTPYLTGLFGVSLVEAQGSTSRTYVAPYPAGTPGSPRGGNLGSFTEININDTGLRVNAVSPQNTDWVTLRDGTYEDFRLFGWTSRPSYNPNDPLPADLYAFGDIVKGQPTTGAIPNNCGTPYACVTVQNRNTDVPSIAGLRTGGAWGPAAGNIYMNNITQQVLQPITFSPTDYYNRAGSNFNNGTLNANAGLTVSNSVYTPTQFDTLVTYIASDCPRGPTPCVLHGTVYVDGTYRLGRSVNLGGNTGDVTLAVRGDLIIDTNVTLTVRHDLTTLPGQQTEGIMVFGLAVPARRLSNVCAGEQANGSGRLIMCGGNSEFLTVDGMLYTADGMFVGSQATVDVIGAMYHQYRASGNASYTNNNATVVVRLNPLALRAVGSGISEFLSWQQLK